MVWLRMLSANVARLLSSIGGYAYEASEKELYMNLFIGGDMKAELNGGENRFHVETGYPWNGTVKVTVENDADTEFAFAIRVPGWCISWNLTVNGEKAEYAIVKGYAYLNRTWKSGDTVEFTMEMPVQLISANPRVREDIGKVAVMRGPVVFCLEETDNGRYLQQLSLKKDTEFEVKFEEDLLKGVVTITADGLRLSDKGWNESTLYKPYAPQYSEQKLKFIPYYAWTNREVGEMLVWVRI